VIGNTVLVMKLATGECQETTKPKSAAMGARLVDRLWDVSDIVKLIEKWETTTTQAE
jgi:hypothetical protein